MQLRRARVSSGIAGPPRRAGSYQEDKDTESGPLLLRAALPVRVRERRVALPADVAEALSRRRISRSRPDGFPGGTLRGDLFGCDRRRSALRRSGDVVPAARGSVITRPSFVSRKLAK